MKKQKNALLEANPSIASSCDFSGIEAITETRIEFETIKEKVIRTYTVVCNENEVIKIESFSRELSSTSSVSPVCDDKEFN